MDNYKKIIKSRRVRLFILKLFFWVPNKLMLKLQYRIKLRRKLNFKNPKRFTEKIQKYKVDYRDPILPTLVDKNEVRKYVDKKEYGWILVKKYGVYNKFNDINFNVLPKEFIMKSTNGAGGNQVLKINKDDLDIDELKKNTKHWFKKTSSRFGGREFSYHNLKGKILIEELLVDEQQDLMDYKFLCFNGKCHYVIVDIDRSINHTRNIYDLDWNNLNVKTDRKTNIKQVEKPKNFNQMLEIANELSKDFPFLRVDLYNIKGKVFFGELTFYPWSGYVSFVPDEFDFKLGELFKYYN